MTQSLTTAKMHLFDLLINLSDPFSTRPSDRSQIWHACADRDETDSHQHFLTHTTPGEFRGYLLCGNDVCGMFVCLCDNVCGYQLRLTYLFRGPLTSDRAQIWHACADIYSHLNIFFTHPTPGVFRGYLLLKIFREGPRPNLARMCG